MQKILCIFFIFFLFAKADMIIAPNSLPPNAQAFIAANFTAQIGLAQRDDDSFEVYLTDGTELEFDMMGNWKELKSRMSPLNPNILPPNIVTILQNTYQGAFITKIERKISYFEVKFSNRLEIKIDPNGTILSQEYDD